MKTVIVLLAVFGGLYSLLLSIVQYRSANNPTPENVSDVYDAETYLKWKRYSCEHSRSDIFFTVISSLITVILLCTNSYSWFASLFPDGAFFQLLAVVLLEIIVSTIVSVVRNYVDNMIIEQKYGFNKSNVKTFVFDCIRSFVIELALTLCLVGLMLVWHTTMGDWLIVFFAAAVFVISLVITFLYPALSRIGNKFVPLQDGELRSRLTELLTKHGYTVKDITVMDASRRTTKLNAYFSGFGKTKTIVLYDNLVNSMTTDEICAVFSHELGHGLHKDIAKMQIMNIGNLLIMAVLVWLSLRDIGLFNAFGFSEINYGFTYILLSVELGITSPLTNLFINMYSRRAEYSADKQAVLEGYGDAIVFALKKLAKDNFAHLAPSKINVVMEYSHPPLSSRIEAIERLNKNK